MSATNKFHHRQWHFPRLRLTVERYRKTCRIIFNEAWPRSPASFAFAIELWNWIPCGGFVHLGFRFYPQSLHFHPACDPEANKALWEEFQETLRPEVAPVKLLYGQKAPIMFLFEAAQENAENAAKLKEEGERN